MEAKLYWTDPAVTGPEDGGPMTAQPGMVRRSYHGPDIASMDPAAPSRRAAAPKMPAAVVTVYGTSWCLGTQVVRHHLAQLGVRYRYVALDLSPETFAQLKSLTGSNLNHPTVSIAGEVLVEPTLGELDWALNRLGLL